jgi:hypothetical protein
VCFESDLEQGLALLQMREWLHECRTPSQLQRMLLDRSVAHLNCTDKKDHGHIALGISNGELAKCFREGA